MCCILMALKKIPMKIFEKHQKGNAQRKVIPPKNGTINSKIIVLSKLKPSDFQINRKGLKRFPPKKLF